MNKNLKDLECPKQSLKEQSTCLYDLPYSCSNHDNGVQTQELTNIRRTELTARNGPALNLIFFFNKVPEQSSGQWEVFSAGATGKTGYAHGWGEMESGGNMTHSLPHTTHKKLIWDGS